MNKFWVVWCEGSQRVTYKHDSFDSAKTEAKRLARENTDTKFHVMEYAGTAVKVDVSFYEYPNEKELDDGIPF